MERKFKYYIIKTSCNNGQFKLSQDIQNYKEALKEYSKTKEDNKNNDVHIEFFGVLQNGEFQLLFDKQIITLPIVNNEVKIDSESIENLYDIMNNINTLVDKIGERKEYIFGLLGSFDKKRDVIYHEIENCDEATGTEKIAIYDKLKSIINERRKIKDEGMSINTLDGVSFAKNFKDVYKSINKTKVKLEKKKEKIQTMIQNSLLQNNQIVKEIPYNNHKDRITLVTQMQKKYDKVAYDEEKKVIICYNKVYGT